MLNDWTTQRRVTPQDWKGLVSALLEARQQLQWLSWWRHKATKIEKRSVARAVMPLKTSFLVKGSMLTSKNKSGLFVDGVIEQCHVAALIAWDIIEEVGKILII